MTVNHARAERSALCDLFEQLGPDAPTLCEGWTARDLAAHLVVRESRPDAAAGILAPPLARYGDSVRDRYAARPWDRLVASVRNGPPRFSPMRLGPLDRATNTVEFFVHHEDLRRGAPGWEPRTLGPGLEDELWKILTRMGRLLARRSPVGVVAEAPGRAPLTLRAAEPTVRIRGDVGEILLFLEGRQGAARVELDGPPDAAEALRTARFGI